MDYGDTTPAGPGPVCDPRSLLQPSHRSGPHLLDSSVHSFSWHATADGDGRSRGGSLPDWLAEKRNVAVSTQNRALNAILSLYREVLQVNQKG
ncbi:MAG: phage integrase N-terminal SAM-like domain-containing protein [Desulfuromonadales bacterium]|nr:phage integrase N-terminal SAM-like domain-containing protein [Desulfuromonadales bacterium]